jgi:hypothetical protein
MYSSCNNFERIRWPVHVTCCSQQEMHTELWLESLNGSDHLEDLGTGGRMILDLILKKMGVRLRIGLL